jgi:GGDEF domain-containing protein
MDAFMTEPMMHAVVREKLQRARGRREQSWSFIDIRLDDAGDLRDAIGEAAFTATAHRFEAVVAETLPAEADLCRVTPGHVLVFASQPSAVVREFVRTVINEIAAPSADAPTSMRLSASAGIVAVDIGSATYESLFAAASEAADRAQRDGGDKWLRVDARPTPTA